MITDPREMLSQRFADVSRGYLACPAGMLPFMLQEMLDVLPARPTLREEAIVAAVQHGINYPEFWTRGQRPRKLIRRWVFNDKQEMVCVDDELRSQAA